MKITIYGRNQCPYCVFAKNLADRQDAQVTYIDMIADGISAMELSELAGKVVTTVPQIFVDGVHVGGYDDFQLYLEHHKEFTRA